METLTPAPYRSVTGSELLLKNAPDGDGGRPPELKPQWVMAQILLPWLLQGQPKVGQP